MRTNITETLIKDAHELATKGTAIKMIAQLLGIADSTTRKNTALRTAIQDGRNIARRNVIGLMEELIKKDPTALIKTADRLMVFTDSIEIKKPTSIDDAVEISGTFIKLYADGKINANQLRTMEAGVNSFIKILEMTEVKKDLELIKEHLRIKGIK